jgi:chromate transporter
MHRYLVSQLGWLSDSQFTSSIALAQAAPGPNILFVALMGWNVGLNASQGAAWWMQGALALTGVCVAMLGIMLPSSILTYTATRWAHQHRDMLAIRAFKSGMAPIVIALLMATGWLLTVSHDQPARDWPLYLLTLLTTLVVWRSRIHMLWLIGLGALLGGLGWV